MRNAILNLLTAIIYFILARAGLFLAFESSNATPVWPASGFAFALIFLQGYKVLPGIMLGAFAANVFTFLTNKSCDAATAVWVSFIISIGNSGEAWVGYYLLKQLRKVNNIFRSVKNVSQFLIVALLMCIVGCTIGATAVVLGKLISAENYLTVWSTWWAGDVSGVLLITPLLVAWMQIPLFRIQWSINKIIEALVLFLVTLLVSGVVFEVWFSSSFVITREFLVIPLLIWTSFRFATREIVIITVVSGIFAVIGTISGRGPFYSASLNESLLTVVAFISLNSILALLLNATVFERKLTEDSLRTARDELEERVKERTKQLEASYMQLAEAQRLAQIGSWEWDVAKNQIQWSDELYRIFGLSKNKFEADYDNYIELLHPDDRTMANDAIQRALQAKEPFDFYHRVIRPDGEIRIIHGRGEVFTNDKGEVIKMTGTGQDVTERKIAEDMLAEMTTELRQKNKELERSNDELASFSYVAGHDLQEPLRKIRTFGEKILLEDFEKLSDVGKDYFRRMQDAAKRMQGLIEDLLSYSNVSISETAFEETDINAMIEEVKNELSEIILQKKAIVEVYPLSCIKIIRFQFNQLLTNIISNSLKFSKKDILPHIVIKGELVKADAIKEFEGRRGKNYYHISISDNGIGFDQQYRDRIFQIFQRLHGQNEFPGTGIGLAICKKIVQNHQGFISANGKKGQGAIFDIYIPV